MQTPYTLQSTNTTDRFITSSGKYMVNVASAFNCVFFIYKVQIGHKFKLKPSKSFLYMNYLTTDTLPEYDQTGLAVKDFASGDTVLCNNQYLLISLTERNSTYTLSASDFELEVVS